MSLFPQSCRRMSLFPQSCRRTALALLALAVLPVLCRAEPLNVTVSGVKDEALVNNIMASLKIARQKDSDALTVGQIRRLHEQAEEQIAEALAPLGYYSVQVEGSLNKDEKGWQALYAVDPGPPVLVDAVVVEVSGPGSEQPSLRNLAEKFPLRPGDRLDDSLYEAGKKRIMNMALSLGYVKARFAESRVEVRHKEHRASVRLLLESGPLYFFGETVGSQDFLEPELFQHYVPYQPGDVYSLELLSRLQSDLYSTGYFSQVSVEPKMSQMEADERRIPVEVHLQEARKNRYSFGAGYGTDTGARGTVGWKNRMINRLGHRPSFNVQLAENGSRAAAGYEIPLPILDLRYDTLSFDGLYSEEDWENTSITQFTVGSSVKHNAPKYQFGASLEYLHEAYAVEGSQDDSTYLLMPGAFLTMILAENRVNADNGLRIGGSVKGAQEPFLASTSFFQFRVGGKLVLTPAEKWRLLGRASFGATAMESIDRLPPSLRFYAGGDQSVRGYGYRKLGPRNKSGKVVGGQYLTEASVELERRLFGKWSAAVFYDLGNAYDNIDADLQQGLGVGVRMTLPFGQIRLDLAEPLAEPGFSLRIHLTMGADL